MKITIFGAGYVGLVTGACFAQTGNEVTVVDVDAGRVEQLNQGHCPIFEPGLKSLIETGLQEKRLAFTTEASTALAQSEVIFIAVGTPTDPQNGSACLDYVHQVARTIGEQLVQPAVIVTKSTVPVGTTDTVATIIQETLAERASDVSFNVAFNPEFLKEGCAVDDFMRPDRIILGCQNPEAIATLKQLYAPFSRQQDKLMVMDVRSAELTKYAANAMLATRISFMNEIALISEQVNADIESVRQGIGADPRIGSAFLYPGCGYGGSCFPKDVRALIHTANEFSIHPQLLQATHEVNERQKQRLFEKVSTHFEGNLQGKCFALWGLAFKPNTDDIREAASRTLMEALWEAGARVQAYDQEAMSNIEKAYPDQAGLALCASPEAALENADALIIATEWMSFRTPDFHRIREALQQPVIFDGRNLYDPAQLEAEGFRYYSIGRS